MGSIRAAVTAVQLPSYVSTLPEPKGISQPQNNRWSTWCQRSVGWPESIGARLSKLIWGSSFSLYLLNRFPGIGFAQHWQHCDQPAARVGRCYLEGRQRPPVRWTARSASSSPVAIPTPRPGADFIAIWLWWCNFSYGSPGCQEWTWRLSWHSLSHMVAEALELAEELPSPHQPEQGTISVCQQNILSN